MKPKDDLQINPRPPLRLGAGGSLSGRAEASQAWDLRVLLGLGLLDPGVWQV